MVRGLCYSSSYQFLGAFAVLQKTTVSSIPVRPSVRPSVLKKQLGTHCADFHEIW